MDAIRILKLYNTLLARDQQDQNMFQFIYVYIDVYGDIVKDVDTR